MEKKFYTDNFERLLKERSDEFRMYPSKRIWHSIYNDLHPSRKWPSIAMSMLLIIALLFVGYLNTDSPSNVQLGANFGGNHFADGSRNSKGNPTSATGTINDAPSRLIAQVPVKKDDVAVPGTLNIAAANSPFSPATPFVNSNTTQRVAASVLNVAATDGNIAAVTNTIGDQNTNRNTRSRNQRRNSTAASIVVTNADAENINFTTDLPARQKAVTAATTEVLSPDEALTATDPAESTDLTSKAQAATVVTVDKQEDNSIADKQGNLGEKQRTQQETEKAWIENYAFYGKSSRKKWKDRMAFEVYTTPSMGYRKLSGDAQYDPASSLVANPSASGNVSNAVRHDPGLSLEAGIGLVYSAAKKLRLKGGVQLNFTNYNIHADKTSHPILTTLLLNDLNTGLPYIRSTTSTIGNGTHLQPAILHSKTYQVSLPLGVAMKLTGNSKFEWYAGASIQPSYVFGGQAYLISSDRKNYIPDPSFIRKWNLNTGVETYVSYNLGNFNLQAGPHFRYQLFSTYNKQYTNTEKLYNVGLKIGLLKSF